MAHLVANYSPQGSELHRRVCRGVEKGRLQNRCRKHDLVERGVKIRVDRLRGHIPAEQVCGRVHAGHLQSEGEGACSHHVLHVQASLDGQSRVVHPPVREADLDLELAHLRHGLNTRGLSHPLHLQQPLLQGLPNALHHRQRALLCVRGEVLGDVELAQLIAQSRFQSTQGPLPSRLLLLRAHELLLEECEVRIHEGLGQVLREAVYAVEQHVVGQ
mmetsp:Transcript_33191/g.73153  ORF Transcript_33191/g.73153 Transcript_33191/m.73153 type:complete len:216 (-) Transcript_33191:1091-1738(-)